MAHDEHTPAPLNMAVLVQQNESGVRFILLVVGTQDNTLDMQVSLTPDAADTLAVNLAGAAEIARSKLVTLPGGPTGQPAGIPDAIGIERLRKLRENHRG